MLPNQPDQFLPSNNPKVMLLRNQWHSRKAKAKVMFLRNQRQSRKVKAKLFRLLPLLLSSPATLPHRSRRKSLTVK